MTKLMLIRHGDTDWNAEEIFRGRANVELNETGIKQAELLAKHLAYERMVATYSSPLKRALRTAVIIATPHCIDVITAPELVDFDYGNGGAYLTTPLSRGIKPCTVGGRAIPMW